MTKKLQNMTDAIRTLSTTKKTPYSTLIGCWIAMASPCVLPSSGPLQSSPLGRSTVTLRKCRFFEILFLSVQIQNLDPNLSKSVQLRETCGQCISQSRTVSEIGKVQWHRNFFLSRAGVWPYNDNNDMILISNYFEKSKYAQLVISSLPRSASCSHPLKKYGVSLPAMAWILDP